MATLQFKVIQSPHFQYQSKTHVQLPINSDTNLQRISNILRSTRQIFTVDRGCLCSLHLLEVNC